MEFPSWDIYSRKFPSNICPPMEFPSHQIYPSLWKFHVRITPPLGNPKPECPLPHLSPGNSKVNTPSPGNSKVNTPPPLEIPRFLNRGGADNNWNSPLLCYGHKRNRVVIFGLKSVILLKYVFVHNIIIQSSGSCGAH